ncbi:MAG: thioredoxin [Candidatus Levybacteria bacterium]|nr:thioredoxin [Candidatus Levybacteria bacterium]
MAELIITDESFEQDVLQSRIPVLVDFWAAWCTPCKIIGPIVEELAKEYAGKLKVGKVNVDENQNIAVKYGIMSIPTLLLFKKGEPVKSLVGMQGKDRLKREIEEILA